VIAVDALYREYILDHYKNPRNFGELEEGERDAEFFDRNPLCGDELGVHVRLEGDRVADVRFHGQGCAISQAAASIISDELKGKTVPEVAALDRHFVIEELGIDLSPTRLKCGLLSLKVVQGALLGTDEWPSGAEDAVDVGPEQATRLRTEV
jgi:nitrogen fixation NifU-like protein